MIGARWCGEFSAVALQFILARAGRRLTLIEAGDWLAGTRTPLAYCPDCPHRAMAPAGREPLDGEALLADEPAGPTFALDQVEEAL